MKSENTTSTFNILNRSFSEMVHHLDSRLLVSSVEAHTVQQSDFASVMFSIASSTFKYSLFLHFAKQKVLEANIANTVQFDTNKDIDRQYQDYISELGNNVCGAISRMLENADFSTGISTPVTLKIQHGIQHMNTLNPAAECHKSCSMGNNALIYASLYLFINEGHENQLLINVGAEDANAECSGELEFF